MASTKILRAVRSVWFTREDGTTGYIKRGTYHEDAPQLRGIPDNVREAHFETFEPDFGPVVEQATAAPGEKRTTRRKAKAEVETPTEEE